MLKENMKSIYWKLYSSIPFCYPYIIRKELEDCKSILDVGCGLFPVVSKIDINPNYSVGVEVVPQYAKKAKIYLDHVIIGDIRGIEFPEKSFDAVVAIGVIEHLKKNEAKNIMLNMIKWARKKVIITTPNEELPGYVDPELHTSLQEYQIHKCSFSAEELRALGFLLYGIRGSIYLGYNIRKNFPVVKILSLLSQPIVKNKAELASGLLGILEI